MTGQTFTARAHQGETLDALVWRVLAKGAGVVEQVMILNPGICENGPILPTGREVILPIIPTDPPVRDMVQLWG
ncbi:MAG: tail protein X [Asticcacaulis sp.]